MKKPREGSKTRQFPWSKTKNKSEMSHPKAGREFLKRKRERFAILFLTIAFCLLTYVEIHISNLSHKLPFINSIFFFGLVNFNVALLLFLLFLIFRNGAKIFAERRGSVVGSRLQSKLTMAFVFFAFVPTVLLFLVSVFYINSSFDKWFSLKVGNVLQDSLDVTNAYFLNRKKSNYHFASKIAEQVRKAPPSKRPAILAKYQKEYRLDAVEYYPDIFGKRVLAMGEEPLQSIPRGTMEFLQKGLKQKNEASTVHQFSEGNLVRCIVPVPGKGKKAGGAIVVSSFIPLSLISKMDDIAMVSENYRDVNPLKYPIKSIYLVILVLITLLIFFGATWFGFHLAKQLSTPLNLLSKAAEQIRRGRYQKVKVQAGSDEVYQLVRSFNKMMGDLSESEVKLREHSRYIEVILSNVSAGVISANHDGYITTVNKYASQLLNVDPDQLIGKHFKDVLVKEHQQMLQDLIRKLVKHRARSIQKELQVQIQGEKLVLQATLSLLKSVEGGDLGLVLVVDDLTKLMNAQRAAAWREVARRIAHEIKNPLTPIRLSAERLQRRFSNVVDDAAFNQCTQTIISSTDELKSLVNEFSSFARLPRARLSLNNLNRVIDESLVLYREGHKNIQFKLSLDPNVPDFDLDPEQIKRVMINIYENAVIALGSEKNPHGSVAITTQYDTVLKIVRINVADNGPGISPEMRERIFEPYYTTKQSGTGLGLAIVKRIVDDHSGFIRVQRNRPKGTRFVIELPANVKVLNRNDKTSDAGEDQPTV